MGRLFRAPASAISGPHASGRLAPAALGKIVLALSFGALTFLEFERADGPVQQIVGTAGFSRLAAAFVAGVIGVAMAWFGQRGRGRDAPTKHVAAGPSPAGRFETFWTCTPDSLFSVKVGETGQFTYSGINPAHERLTGLRAADITGKTPDSCLKPEVAACVSARYRECVKRGNPVTYESALDLPTGVRHLRTCLVPIPDPVSGRIVLILGSVRDVTADRTAHEELSRLNERLQSILSSISDSYCILGSDWRLTFANAAALRWAGKEAAQVIGKSYRNAFSPDTLTGRVVTEAMERRKVVHEELPSATKAGIWLSYNIYPTPDGGLALFFRDVTEIRKAREALSDLPRQILASQDSERRRIASELHNSTIQHIVAASLNLMRLAPPATEADRAACDDVQRSLEEALQELRVFTYLLHPPAIRRDGLVATLRTFLDGFGCRAGLELSVHASSDLDTLPEDLQCAVFRVVQEALSNTHRHARATRVSVQARLIRGTLCVRVSDDGCGIGNAQDMPLELEDATVGVGLRGMRARLKQFGGQLRVRSFKRGGCGTTLVAIVPMARQARSV